MHRIAAVLKVLTQLNKSSINNFIRHECQNGILGGCFFILFDGYTGNLHRTPNRHLTFSVLADNITVYSRGTDVKMIRRSSHQTGSIKNAAGAKHRSVRQPKPPVAIVCRLIHFGTKHISLLFVSFDTIIFDILPIILGFKL